MRDCLVPCHLCCDNGCGGGGCGPFHGCLLGGRKWGCSMCCGGCGGGCCPNPAGSVFDGVCCGQGHTSGGHCHGCGGGGNGMPILSDPFQDDPVPQPPKPTASPTSYPGSEVRRAPTHQPRPASPVA